MRNLLILLTFLLTTVAYSFPIGYHTQEIYDGITKNAAGITETNRIMDAIDKAKVNYAVLTIKAPYAAADEVEFDALPKNAIIKNTWYEVKTQVVSANSNTIALACGANSLFDAADVTGSIAGTISAGKITATATTYKSTGATGCKPTLTVGAGASGITAGEILFYVEYVVR